MLENDVKCVDDAGDVAQNRQADVNQQVYVAAGLEEHADWLQRSVLLCECISF